MNGQEPTKVPQQPEIIMTITYRPPMPGVPSFFNINGPINDKILAYGMLMTAMDAVRNHIDKKDDSGILVSGPISGLDRLPKKP